MGITRRIATATKLAVLCLLAAGALAHATGSHSQPPDEGAAAAGKPAAFHVKGHLKGIYPGQKTSMKVKVTNAGHARITLTRLKVKVRSTVAGCPSSSLKFTPFKGHRKIRGDATIAMKLAARMKATSPDACQGARYRLTFAGRAS